jgi:hypothetical protein
LSTAAGSSTGKAHCGNRIAAGGRSDPRRQSFGFPIRISQAAGRAQIEAKAQAYANDASALMQAKGDRLHAVKIFEARSPLSLNLETVRKSLEHPGLHLRSAATAGSTTDSVWVTVGTA